MKKSIVNLLCCDISFDASLDFFVPSIYVAADPDFQYIDKKISLDNCTSFGVGANDFTPIYKSLFATVAEFKKEAILKKFDKTKKIQTVTDLKKNKVVDKLLTLFIDSKIDQFLCICVENNIPISVQLGTKKEYYAAVVEAQKQVLEPILRFNKTDIGVDYTLQLANNNDVFYPLNHTIQIVANEPSWIVVDKKLFQINNLNANKLKPFVNTKSIFIPNSSVVDYFEKFIKNIVQKVAIDVTGFEIDTKNKVEKCTVVVVNNFFKNRYEIGLNFDYDGYVFDSNSQKSSHSLLDIPNLENIKVTHFKRNFADELNFEQHLQSFGFEKTHDLNYVLPSNDSYASLQFVINNKAIFETNNFYVGTIKIDGKVVQTETAVLQANSQEKQDWFDLKMTIFCGDYQFSFAKIVNHIKNKNRLFALDSENYFLIPGEWMTDFAPLSNFAHLENDRLVLPKANINLLHNTGYFKTSASEATLVEPQFIEFVKTTLRPYQIEGVKWLFGHYQNSLGACLADDMGLGKTLQTLATLVAVQHDLSTKNATNIDLENDLFAAISPKIHALKALIVLPASLLFNWYNEAKKFTPHFKMILYSGTKRSGIVNRLKNYDLIFTTYATVSKDILLLEKIKFSYLILDESQYIKNKNAQVFKNINKIDAAHKISLSGTPIENSLADLWSQMQFINPNILGSYSFFQKYFQIPIQKNKNENKIAELKQIISPFILRRTKKQVLTELPDYSETIFLTEMSAEQEKCYEQEKSNARNKLLNIDQKTSKINILNSLMRLRQWSNHPKMIDTYSEINSGKFQDATNYLETLVRSNQKVLIFSSFVSHLKLYKDWCDKNKFLYSFLTGETPNEERKVQVNRFKNNLDVSLFFMSIGTGNVGLNLQEASFVVFLDPWWNPFKEVQAISRAHRMGQKAKVEVVKFISKNTIEEKIIELQKLKKVVANDIIEDSDLPIEMEENLSFLLQ